MQIPKSLGVEKAQLVVLGEVHGTNEIPGLLLQCVEEIGRPLSVGLELPPSAIADDDARFWRGTDGRASEEMMALVCSLHEMPHVHIFGFDDDTQKGFREQRMADSIHSHLSEHQTWVLTGNLHARRTRGVPWDPNFVPMVCRLLQKEVNLLSFDVRSHGGTAWVATSDGVGPAKLAGDASFADVGCYLFGEEMFDGVFQVGPVTASPPARRA